MRFFDATYVPFGRGDDKLQHGFNCCEVQKPAKLFAIKQACFARKWQATEDVLCSRGFCKTFGGNKFKGAGFTINGAWKSHTTPQV